MLRPSATVACLWTALLAAPAAEAARPDPRPSLVVLFTVDQLASSYLERWGHLLREGFGPLIRRGAHHPRGAFAHAHTETAPGHSTVATGAWPNVHGMVANRWRDPESGKRVIAFEDPEHGYSPSQLLVPTLADALRLGTRGKSKVVSLATKPRAAVPLGGRSPRLVVWYEEASGRFVPGRWAGLEPPPEWFVAASRGLGAEASEGQTWDRLRADVDYASEAGPDERPFEEDVAGLGRTFPRVMGAGAPSAAAWRETYPGSAAAVSALTELARAALREERLGQRGVVDLLAVSYGALDYAGHHWGSTSQEALDILLRIDRGIGEIVRQIERELGEQRALFVITADHGVTLTPEEAVAIGLESRRLSRKPLVAAAHEALERLGSGVRVAELNAPRIYLTPPPATRGAKGPDRLALARAVAEAVRSADGVLDAHATEDLARFAEPFRTYFARAQYPGRSPDVLLLLRPFHYLDEGETGTSHGTPYVYDQTVPIVISGPGVRRGVDPRPYDITRIAPSIAALLGIDPPAAAFEAPLPAVLPPRL